MNELTQLNTLALEEIANYTSLKAFGTSANTPYFINNMSLFLNELTSKAKVAPDKAALVNQYYMDRDVLFGWYLGKGSPDQISEAVTKMTSEIGFDSVGMNSEGLLALMNFFGLGVDCSGFVYDVLLYAFNGVGKGQEFIDSLNWTDPTHTGPLYAGVSVFTGSASSPIEPVDVQPLDIILLEESGVYEHIGMFVEKDGQLFAAQSDINTNPTGPGLFAVNKTTTGIEYDFDVTFGSDWNKLAADGVLQTHRLGILA